MTGRLPMLLVEQHSILARLRAPFQTTEIPSPRLSSGRSLQKSRFAQHYRLTFQIQPASAFPFPASSPARLPLPTMKWKGIAPPFREMLDRGSATCAAAVDLLTRLRLARPFGEVAVPLPWLANRRVTAVCPSRGCCGSCVCRSSLSSQSGGPASIWSPALKTTTAKVNRLLPN